VRWRFVALEKSLFFSTFLLLARDALAALLREHGKDEQAELLMRGELASLTLSQRPISDDGAEIVADFLKHDETVRTVSLWDCRVEPRPLLSL
jgi:hypothetical protein